jgi:tripartite-type tricarboxylate transporter receptor subunit TctC
LPAYLPLITSGSVAGLAINSAERAKALPDVPTAREAGIPALVADNWFGLLAPAGTPDAIVEKLSRTVARALAEPKMKDDFERAGAAAVAQSPAEFRGYITNEKARWGELIKRARIATN